MSQHCFAETRGGCNVMKEKNCYGCKFHKTDERIRLERIAAQKRLIEIGMWGYCKAKYNLVEIPSEIHQSSL